MELTIKQFEAQPPIEWNYPEIKAWALEQKQFFETVVYTDDDIAQAKQDRADLNRMAKVISGRRIEISREWNKPLEEFVTQAKEIEQILADAAKSCDKPIKEWEERKKADKEEAILAMYGEIEGRPEWLPVDKIWNPKWLNATTSMKSIKDEITARITEINQNVATLQNLGEFAFEATEVYKTTLDMAKAILEGQRLADIQRRKLEEEQRRKDAEARIAAEREARRQQEALDAMNAQQMQPEPDYSQDVDIQPVGPMPEFAQWVSFAALITSEQGKLLKQFCIDNGIQLRRI